MGGAVELGIISEILGIQFYVYRRGGQYYHIDNTQIDNAHRIDLDYTGNHYNLVLLPGMPININVVAAENVFYCNSVIYNNPILNDKKIAQLFKLVKSHFGMKGIDRLMDIGLKPEEYQEFQGLRKILGDEVAIKFYLGQELRDPKSSINNIETEKNNSSLLVNLNPEIIILDPTGGKVIIRDEYGQKLQLQLAHYYLTGELFETAATALQQGYTVFTYTLEPNYVLPIEKLQVISLNFNETREQIDTDYYNQEGECNHSITAETFNTPNVEEQSYDYSILLGLLFAIEITAQLSGDLSNPNHVF